MAKRFQTVPFNKMHMLVLFIFFAISVFSLRSFFATGDPVGFHDFTPMYRLDQLYRPYDFPWDYKSNLGSPLLLTGNYVYFLPFISLSIALGSAAFAGKVLMVLLMALSGFGFYAVFNYLLKSRTAGFVAGLYMMFSPFTLSRWQYGHNTVLLAYAVLPFALFCFFKLMKEGGRISLFLCGLLTALMIYTSPQVAYMFILFVLLYVVFDVAFSGRTGIAKKIVDRTVQIGLVLAVALVVAFPFFYQLVMVNIPVYATRAEEAAVTVYQQDVFTQILPQAILGFGVITAFFVLWWKSGFKKMYRWWKTNSPEESPPFLIRENRQLILCFAVLGLLSMLLVLLVIQPLLPAYYWLFNNVPGLGMFREVSKFFMLATFSAALFLGIAAEGIKRYLSKGNQSAIVRKAVPILLISLLVCGSSWQFLTGDVGGFVGTVAIPQQYQELDNWLASQKGDFRIAFFPPAVWATVYSWAPREILNPYVALQAKPTVEIKSEQDLTPSAGFSKWVYTTLYSNRTSNWGKLLSALGVKYVILQTDATMQASRRDLVAFALPNTLSSWNSQRDLQLKENLTSVVIYENPHPIPPLYQTNGFSVIAGDRGALLSLNTLDFNFTQNPPAFLDNNFGSASSLVNNANYIFLQGDPYWNLLVPFLGPNYVVKPWNYAPVSANPWNKWVSGDLTWFFFNGELNVATDGYIYTDGAHTISIPLNVGEAGDYRIIVQVYNALPDSQGISFTIDNGAAFVSKPDFSAGGAYRWVDLGYSNLISQSKIQISSLGGPAAVSKIAVIPESAINAAEQNVSKVLQAQVAYIFDDRSWSYNHNATILDAAANDGKFIALKNSTVETDFYVFNDGTYTLTLTFQSSRAAQSVKVRLDETVSTVTVGETSGDLANVEIGPVALSQGHHKITISAETGDPKFTMATLTEKSGTPETDSGNDSAEVPSYNMLSGSEYRVTPTAKYLVFLEAGDDYWQLQHETAPRISIFNYASLFTISQPGRQYTLKYLGQGYLQQGALGAIVGTVIIAVVLKFAYPKRLIKRKTQT
jgi:hypothetical protein